jgi:methylmalonyl-CoA mutase N-terminal domain/subunit
MEEHDKIPVMKTDEKLGETQTERLKALKQSRDGQRVRVALESIRTAARTGENLFPVVLEAVRARATLGEIMDEMKAIFSTYTAPSGF